MRGELVQSDWWFHELVDAAAGRVRDELHGRPGAWEGPWRLLHGLTSIGSPALQSAAQAALDGLAAEVDDAARSGPDGRAQPVWLAQLSRITATGEVWEMHDVYGSRFGVIAAFSYPGGVDPSVYLYDVDACGFVDLVHAGVFDDVGRAAAAWREFVGPAAGAASPTPVDTSERLYCLVHWDAGEDALYGTESQSKLDNWFRARRRHHDIADALRRRGMPLPTSELQYGRDTTAAEDAFVAWYVPRHDGAEPDVEAVAALAEEWFDGVLPHTEQAIASREVCWLCFRRGRGRSTGRRRCGRMARGGLLVGDLFGGAFIFPSRGPLSSQRQARFQIIQRP
jgi:hypothetical protein